MSPRFNNLKRSHQVPTTGEAVGTGMAILAGIIVLIIVGITLASIWPARGHDFLLNGTKNPAGEWCCGSYDCGVMISGRVKPVAGGYEVDAVFRITHQGKITDDHVREFWPLHEASPSPDGAHWRCKRPDGSPRCKFVPPPGS
jgi:hypothetical protein